MCRILAYPNGTRRSLGYGATGLPAVQCRQAVGDRAPNRGAGSRGRQDPDVRDGSCGELHAIRAFYVLEREYIDASRGTVVERYGSFDRYVSEALGLDKVQLDALREPLDRTLDRPIDRRLSVQRH
jgi:hypothetical protein